jgi:hypothetical protein
MHGLLRASLMTLALAIVVGLCADSTPADTSPGQPSKGQPSASKGKAGLLEPGSKLPVTALASHIDKLINEHLKAEKADPSPRADDSEFLRRVYLDLTGHIPSGEQAREFIDNKDASKRAKLIDTLLASKDFGRHQADIWQSLLLPHDSEAARLRVYFPNMTRWLQESFNDNKPWNEMVRELLTATGPVDKPGPAVYYLARGSVDKVTDNFSKLFLGVQLQCAQCHNHPFTDWKQEEYWGMAAFFLKVKPDGNPKAAAKNGAVIKIVESKQMEPNRKRLPVSAKILPPKFLQGEKANLSDRDLYRPALADWATRPNNPFLARALVNRVWAQLFGRGFVAPVDDMHDGNTPSHPELLADLSAQFVAHDFNVKHLFRAICNSEAYQRSSKPAGNNKDFGPDRFARMAVKVLSPEQLYDSLGEVLGKPENRPMGKAGGMAGRRPLAPRDQFVASYGLEDSADPTEYQAGIPQVLRLMNSAAFNDTGAVARITRNSKDPGEVIERLYLATLARRPTSEERARVQAHLAKQLAEPAKGHADLLWALMNSSEFSLNR